MTKGQIESDVSKFLATCSDSVEFDELVIFAQHIADKAVSEECGACAELCESEAESWKKHANETAEDRDDEIMSQARSDGFYEMQFSMNGFRRQLSGDTATLRDIVKSVINSDYYDDQDLIEAINQIITHSNVINCVFKKDDPDFSDISHVEIEHLEI